MTARARFRTFLLAAAVAASGLPAAVPGPATAVPNPVATDEATYQAFGRVFPDPHGCLAYGASDSDGDGVKDTPPGVSPWAKGRVCANNFLSYEEVIEGSKFLARRFPRFLKVIRLDQAYDSPKYRSAGIPRSATIDQGQVKLLGRDRRPLYMLKVTDRRSPVPERRRLHFAYAGGIHGIERAGVEGGIRAVEDLVTWAACESPNVAADTPACSVEGPFPKEIVESNTERAVPDAGDVLRGSVIYFFMPNPDGWNRGQTAPVEFEDGNPNANYTPGVFFQRYNGNGVDLNRDWPSVGYTFKPYSPASEPETRAFRRVLRQIRFETEQESFAGGIDLHGMLTAYAFSYTLLGAGERDYRKNAITVDTSIRTYEDQTKRLSWSPYVADRDGDGQPDDGEACFSDRIFRSTRGHVPACVADEWGTVIDTIGYQVTGALGDWLDSRIGLDAVGIDNEMYMSHITPNTVFDPALTQSHIDGNKGLMYSQISSLLTEKTIRFRPTGKVGYVENPVRLQVDRQRRVRHPRLPAQNDIEVLLPCQGEVQQNLPSRCGDATFTMDGGRPAVEFEVQGPKQGIWNGGIKVTVTRPNALGISDGHFAPDENFNANVALQYFDEGDWQTAASDFNQSPIYLQAGQIVTVNDPQPGKWRVLFEYPWQVPSRVNIDFRHWTAEASSGQKRIDVSSMDFFRDLDRYTPRGADLDGVAVRRVIRRPASLNRLDTLVVVNRLGSPAFLRNRLGLSGREIGAYFRSLERFARRGGNLVLTDRALAALRRIGLVGPADVEGDRTLAGNYNFRIGDDLITYHEPGKFPLARDVDKPGAAEQEPGRRQAAEPTPLGYTPDPWYDEDPQMPFYGVERDAWEAVCGLPRCITATTEPAGDLVNLGEARLGRGRVRIAGVMFPDPVFQPDEANDHRFGLSSYALTYTSYEVFENLVDYRR